MTVRTLVSVSTKNKYGILKYISSLVLVNNCMGITLLTLRGDRADKSTKLFKVNH